MTICFDFKPELNFKKENLNLLNETKCFLTLTQINSTTFSACVSNASGTDFICRLFVCKRLLVIGHLFSGVRTGGGGFGGQPPPY